MAKAELKIIGSSPARLGGVDRVVGKGVYGIDLMLKDQLHGAILRSQYAHAKIVSIDTSEAKKVPGVHAGNFFRFAGVDADDLRVGVLAAQDRAVKLVLEHQVDTVNAFADDAIDAAQARRARTADFEFRFGHALCPPRHAIGGEMDRIDDRMA